MPANLNLAHDADPRRNDHLEVPSLLARARNGEERAWDALVDRYAPLICSICRRYRLADADAKDVSQSVWLRVSPGYLAGPVRRWRGAVMVPAWGGLQRPSRLVGCMVSRPRGRVSSAGLTRCARSRAYWISTGW